MTTRFPNGDDDADGTWFLEAVGATDPAPSAGDALADLTRENEPVPVVDEPESDESESADSAEPVVESTDSYETPDTISASSDSPDDPSSRAVHTTMIRTTQTTLSSFDGNPGSTNASFAPSGSLPSLPPAAPLPVAQSAPPPVTPAEQASPVAPPPSSLALADTAPSELSRPLRTGRSFRWPVISILVLLIAAVGIAAIWLPKATDAKAVAVRQDYYDSTAAVRNHLPASQEALDAITSTQSSSDDLSSTIPTIAQLDSLALEMQRIASEPLPSVLPLLPKGSIDALEPLQEQTSLLGSEGRDLASHLGNAYIYRVTIPSLMDTGNLPSSASTETINTISVTLAGSLAADAEVVSQLPDDDNFATVRTLAIETHQRYTTWQTEYLAALSGEDTTTATSLLAELDQMRFDLIEADATALGTVRAEVDAWIVTYAVALETQMSKLSRN